MQHLVCIMANHTVKLKYCSTARMTLLDPSFSLSALTLLLWQEKGHAPCKNAVPIILKNNSYKKPSGTRAHQW